MSTYTYEIVDKPVENVPVNIREQFADGKPTILTFDERSMHFVDSKKLGREFKHFNWGMTTPEKIANSDLPTYNHKFIEDKENPNIAYLKVRKWTRAVGSDREHIYEKIYVKRTTVAAAASPAASPAASGSAAAAAGLGKKRRKSKSRNKKRRSRSINKKRRSRSRKNF